MLDFGRPSLDVIKSWLNDTLIRSSTAVQLEPAEIFAPEKAALYIHVPFCGALCTYCSFNKGRAHALAEDYVNAVVREMRYYGGRAQSAPLRVSSLFIGGGTPSFLPADLIQCLIEEAAATFRFDEAAQITMEANPESLTTAKVAAYRAAGIHRVSVGVQTFDETRLRQLGRRHRASDVDDALGRLQESGFEISLDLMYGLPGQQLDDSLRDLEQAIASPVGHISMFPMIYRPGTAIGRRERKPRGHTAQLMRFYQRALDRLGAAGFVQYMPEDFSRSGVRCQYQLDIWEPPTTPCFGLGAGALSAFGPFQWHNIGPLEQYIAHSREDRPPMARGHRLSQRQLMLEHLLLTAKNLRLDPSLFERRFGVSIERTVGPLPLLLRAAGLARRAPGGTLELTRRGAFYASLLWSNFILDKLARAADVDTARASTVQPRALSAVA